MKQIVADKELENFACGRSRRETSRPVEATSSRSDAPRAARLLAATGLSDRGPAPLHPAPPTGGADPDAELRARLRAFAKDHQRWGYRRAHAVLVPGGSRASTERKSSVCGVRKVSGSAQAPQAPALGISTTPADRLSATHPNHVWALDYQFDVTSRGRTIKILPVVDEHTRESLADVVDHSIDADATVAVLDKVVGTRGRPSRLHPLRQRPRAHRQRPSGLVPVHRSRYQLHRSRVPLAEPLGRVLRLSDA